MLYPLMGEIELDKLVRSPLPAEARGGADTNRSFKVYGRVKDGVEEIFWKDFALGDDQIGYRPVHLAQYLYGLDYFQARDKLEKEAGATVVRGSWTPTPPTTSGVRITALREWELVWWKEYCVSPEALSQMDVWGLVALFHDSELLPDWASTPKSPKFCYILDEDVKAWQAYRPDPKDFFMRNVSKVLGGFNQLPWTGNDLYYVSGMKDALPVITLGQPAVFPLGEGNQAIMESLMPVLKRRFTNHWALFDPDGPGVKATASLIKKFPHIRPLQPRWPRIERPDIAKVSRAHGLRGVAELLLAKP